MTAEELLKTFPKIPDRAYIEMRCHMKHFIIVDKWGTAYCTGCEHTFNVYDDYDIQHRKPTECALCGGYYEVIKNQHNFKGYVREDKEHFFVYLRNPENSNLYVSCLESSLYFEHGKLTPKITYAEVQRYIYTDKKAYRYGRGADGKWTQRTRFTEPVFEPNVSSWYRDCSYFVINEAAIKGSYFEHSAVDKFTGHSVARYLKFYQSHPGAERLLKSGYETNEMVRKMVDTGVEYSHLNWKEKEVHKMLGITRDVFQAIRSHQIGYSTYCDVAELFPGETLDKLISYARVLHGEFGTLSILCKRTKETAKKLLNYCNKQSIRICDYADYIRLCDSVGYNFEDSVVRFPKDFRAMHDRIEQMRQALENEKKAKQLEKKNEALLKLIKSRKKIEFESGDYIIRQPSCIKEIIEEGQKLAHCVGGYAERHADGKLTIMFLRKKDDADTPYYTIEVSNDYKIVQCRGYKTTGSETVALRSLRR